MFVLPPGLLAINIAILLLWQRRYSETARKPGFAASSAPPDRKIYEDTKAIADAQFNSVLAVIRDTLVSGRLTANVVDDDGSLWVVPAEYWSDGGPGQITLRTGVFEAAKMNLYGWGRFHLKPAAIGEATLERWAKSAQARKALTAADQRLVGCINVFQPELPTKPRSTPAKVWLEEWYRDHVATICDLGKRSSLENDLIEAKKRFGKRVTRDRVRELRRKYAPSRWTRPGRPHKS
jgi:hypothetical protein